MFEGYISLNDEEAAMCKETASQIWEDKNFLLEYKKQYGIESLSELTSLLRKLELENKRASFGHIE